VIQNGSSTFTTETRQTESKRREEIQLTNMGDDDNRLRGLLKEGRKGYA